MSRRELRFETKTQGTHPAPVECCHVQEERTIHGTRIVGGFR